jgi:hypothetical protein
VEEVSVEEVLVRGVRDVCVVTVTSRLADVMAE